MNECLQSTQHDTRFVTTPTNCLGLVRAIDTVDLIASEASFCAGPSNITLMTNEMVNTFTSDGIVFTCTRHLCHISCQVHPSPLSVYPSCKLAACLKYGTVWYYIGQLWTHTLLNSAVHGALDRPCIQSRRICVRCKG